MVDRPTQADRALSDRLPIDRVLRTAARTCSRVILRLTRLEWWSVLSMMIEKASTYLGAEGMETTGDCSDGITAASHTNPRACTYVHMCACAQPGARLDWVGSFIRAQYDVHCRPAH